MSDKKPWADEPTPLCAPYYGHWATICTDAGTIFDVARDLEQRLRHAWKLVNSLRIDAMHSDLDRGRAVGSVDPELLEQRLADIEEALQ